MKRKEKIVKELRRLQALDREIYFAVIAPKFGVSKERVRQIATSIGIKYKHRKLVRYTCSQCSYVAPYKMWENNTCKTCCRKKYWDVHHKLQECKRCNKSDSPHKANGLCKKCHCAVRYEKNKKNPKFRKLKVEWSTEWRKKNADKYRAYQREYQRKKARANKNK